MRATFKLLNSYFWKTFYGPIMAFVFPIILLAILGNIFKVEYVYPGIIALSFLFIGLLSLPLSIMEFKQSSLFKYIGSSPVNPMKFTIVVVGYYIFTAIITAMVILGFTMILFAEKVFPDSGFKHGILGGIFGTFVGAVSFYSSTAIHLIFVISVGLLISTFSKTPQQALTFGLVIIIPSMFLSGMILSVDIIAQSSILNWISRIIPFRYSTGNIIIASTPADQIGDMFQGLSVSQKEILFSRVDADGTVILSDTSQGVTGKEYTIKTLRDLNDAWKELGDKGLFSQGSGIRDRDLYQLTFGKVLEDGVQISDNNIFVWTENWAVRRVPEVEPIKQFIMDYFKTFKTENGSGGNWDRLVPFANQISQGEFGWLEIFMKQTNILYRRGDRVLNLLLPLFGSVGILWYVSENFKWSAR